LKSRIEKLQSGAARIGLIFNPLSGRIRKRKDAMRRAIALIPASICREVTNASEIKASVEAFLSADIDLLVIVGGDGTVQGILCHLFATHPLESWPVLAIVPGGTTNMTALDLGVSGKPESVLRHLGEYLQERSTPLLLQRHVLCVEQAGAEKVYGMFLGAGLIARAVIFSQSRIKKLGITGEVYSAVITFGYIIGLLLGRRKGAWAPVDMSIIEPGKGARTGTYAFFFASSLDRLLFDMRPYWGQEQAPLHVTFVEQRRKNPWHSLLSVLKGRGHVLKEQDGYFSCNTQALEVLMDDEYIVDGESYRAASKSGPLRISAAGPVTFLTLEHQIERSNDS
jgi:diacylglycerol kinase (ATP)